MLKSMRQAELGEGIFDNQQSEFYRDMFDQQIALHLSTREGFGFAGLLTDYLSDVTGVDTGSQGAGSEGAGLKKVKAYSDVQDPGLSADRVNKDA